MDQNRLNRRIEKLDRIIKKYPWFIIVVCFISLILAVYFSTIIEFKQNLYAINMHWGLAIFWEVISFIIVFLSAIALLNKWNWGRMLYIWVFPIPIIIGWVLFALHLMTNWNIPIYIFFLSLIIFRKKAELKKQNEKKKEKEKKEDKKNILDNYTLSNEADSGFYLALMEQVLHQDRLLWSRTQILIAVQGAVIGSAYYVRSSYWLSPTIMIFGAVITALTFFLLVKDEQDRDVNRDVMDELAKKLLPQIIVKTLLEKGKNEPFIRITGAAPPWCPFAKGRYIIKPSIIGFFVLDIVLALFYRWAPYLFFE